MHRIDQTLTLGSREVATSRSRWVSVEAFIDSVPESLNQHQFEQVIPEHQREKIAYIVDKISEVMTLTGKCLVNIP